MLLESVNHDFMLIDEKKDARTGVKSSISVV